MIRLLLLLLGVGPSAIALDGGTAVSATSFDAGELAYHVYAGIGSDGGVVPVYLQPDGGLVQLDQFVCAKRPNGVAPNALGCMCRYPDAGLDFGQDNVMQPGGFLGNGCIKTPCVIFSDDTPP